MDPVSIVGLAGSVFGIVDIVSRSISSLLKLQERWKAAQFTVSLLVGHLTTLRAVLNQIAEWISTSPTQLHHQLVIDLTGSLDCCKILILFIDGHVSRLKWDETSNLTLESRVKVVLEDQSVKDCVSHLNTQCIALNLLLTALNWFVFRCNVLGWEDS